VIHTRLLRERACGRQLLARRECAGLGDLAALERVAALDSKRLPAGPLLVAVVDSQIWAAVSTLDDASVADPFVPSGDLVGLLRTRARQLRDTQPQVPVLRLEPLLARLR
jgi:hypothetical protein